MAGGALTVIQAWLLSRAVNRVFLAEQALGAISGLMGMLLAVIVLRAVLAWGMEVAANSVARKVKQDLRQRLFAHLLALGPRYTRGEETGELANTAGGGHRSPGCLLQPVSTASSPVGARAGHGTGFCVSHRTAFGPCAAAHCPPHPRFYDLTR